MGGASTQPFPPSPDNFFPFQEQLETLPPTLLLPPKGDGSSGKKFRLSGREGKHYDRCGIFRRAGL